jgi:integrase
LKDIVSDYFAYLKKYPYTHLSVNRSMAVVMSFLHYFDIPFRPIRIRHPYVVYHNRDITKEEIRNILNNSGVRNRSIYLLLYETGMRPWTAVNLRWRHIKEDFLAKRVPMKVKLSSDILKCGVSERFVFIGDNGFDALSRYLARRQLPLKDDDYVFVTEKPFGQKIGTHALSQAFNVIVKNLKLAEERGKKPKELRLYALRKAFSKFMAVSVDRTLVEYWLGHTNTATHYVPEDLEYHRNMYAKGYSELRLEDHIPSNIKEELNKKDREVKTLKEELQKLKANYSKLLPLVRLLEDGFNEEATLKSFLRAYGSNAEIVREHGKPKKILQIEVPDEILELMGGEEEFINRRIELSKHLQNAVETAFDEIIIRKKNERHPKE